jgi:hypothetical protein
VIRPVLAAAAVAALSALVVAPAPSYDPWAWLLWGREVAHLELSTVEGPAFKPLPVAVSALLAPLGGAAPALWVIVARTGAILATWLAFRAGHRLAGGAIAAGPVAAGVLAAVGVALCGGFLGYAAAGAETGWVIALALAGGEAWRGGRPRAALACGVGCALLRVEAWPFLLAAGVVLWRRRPADRPLLAACAVAVPVLWFVPEWLGSGDLLRSGERARIPNPGQPATAAVPALAALGEAAALLLWPLLIGAVASFELVRSARLMLGAGIAWIAVVALMAQAGFSGEPRYALPGGALVAIAGAAGLVALVRSIAEPRSPALRAPSDPLLSPGGLVAAVVAAALVLAAAVPKLADLPQLRRDQAWARGLSNDLASAILAAGGRDAVLACGRPYVGDLRGPLLAYHLDVEKHRVGFRPAPPGAVFVSRLHERAVPEPPVGDAFDPLARAGRWEVRAACSFRVP